MLLIAALAISRSQERGVFCGQFENHPAKDGGGSQGSQKPRGWTLPPGSPRARDKDPSEWHSAVEGGSGLGPECEWPTAGEFRTRGSSPVCSGASLFWEGESSYSCLICKMGLLRGEYDCYSEVLSKLKAKVVFLNHCSPRSFPS